MSLRVKTFILGPLQNNTYLLEDTHLHEGIVIDPSFEIEELISFAKEQKIKITRVWLTHAHFDHFAGVFQLRETYPGLSTALHSDDLFLWNQGGLSSLWNLPLNMDFTPDVSFTDGLELVLGENKFTVLHTPGHSPGHVVFYNQPISSVFCGDLILDQGVGRTDLPGGSKSALQNSIMTKIFSLPPTTTLYSGHGPKTTVQEEKAENPYL